MSKPRRRFIYLITSHNKHYIVTRQQFIDRLAIQNADQVVYAGWCGVDVANYEKAKNLLAKMQRTRITYVYEGISFRVMDNERWQNYPEDWKQKYAIYVGKVEAL